MSDRPSQLWKNMPSDKRVEAAEAFWRDTESQDIQAQHAEALVALAKRLNFRMRTLQTLPVERRAKHLAQLGDVSDPVATRALIAYHFATKRPLMGAFLDALGITHEEGLISEEQVTPPTADRLAAAVATLKGSFDETDVDLYLRTLATLDGETWTHLADVLKPSH
ncbi:MAG: hypothetical protein ABI634_05815 [Acidobacteriota bacterium]